MINIFIGNLGPDATEEQLLNLFAAHGAVDSITIVNDRNTGQSRGCAFVEMREGREAQSAISSLNGTLLNGRPIKVNEARPKLGEDATRPSQTARAHRRHRI
jgi:cold-inducible RNA-binding protein